MRIAVIGAGAMGSIYGGRLSLKNEVYLIDSKPELVEHINREGLRLDEDGESNVYHPTAVLTPEGLPEMDLVILFVKSLYSRAALDANRSLIGPATRLLTLQNGSGHEELLSEFADREHIIIGTTEDNGTVLGLGHVRRGGEGRTNVGMLCEDSEGFLPKMKESFDSCGFRLIVHENIQQLIWDKLFTNVSLSAVTGILQVKMGYIHENEYAWRLTTALIHEAVQVAQAMGLSADEEKIREKVRSVSMNSPEGITSICADLGRCRKTEVDTISGSVVRAARKIGVPAPSHEFLVNLVHALEERGQ